MQVVPKNSILIVTWNAGEHLFHCLSALSLQTNKEFEIVVVDNGSTDGAVDGLEYRWTESQIIFKRLDTNQGFAVANNIAAKLAHGEWIILLNADAYPEPDWLENLLKAAEQNPQYNFFSSRQIQYNAPDLLDGSGDAYHVSGLAWRWFYGLPIDQYGLEQKEVFGACGAAAMYRREDFLAVGGFDETFFSYFEDVDLSFRLRLSGGRCLYVASATVYHVGSASTGKTSDFSYYHIHRNLIWTFFKNMPLPFLALFLPLHVLSNTYFALRILVIERRWIALRAKWDALLGLPQVLLARKKVQPMRKIRLHSLYRVIEKNLFAKQRRELNKR